MDEKLYSDEEKMILVPIWTLLTTGLLFLNPFILTLLWNWFVSPLFGIIELTYLSAFGLLLVYSILPKGGSTKYEKNTDYINQIAKTVSRYVFIGIVVLIAVVIKGFM